MKSLSALAVMFVSLVLSYYFGGSARPLVIGLLLFLAGLMIRHLKQHPGRAGAFLTENWPPLLVFGPGYLAFLCVLWLAESVAMLACVGIMGVVIWLEMQNDERCARERYGQFRSRQEYLDVLISAARADGDLTDPEVDRLAVVAGELFARSEFVGKSHDGFSTFILERTREPTNAVEAAQIMASLTSELRDVLRFQVASMLHGGGDLGPEGRAWLDRCLGHAGEGPWPVLRYFDHGFTAGAKARREWLAELGLPEQAGPEDVRAAYRARAREYHPDMLAGVPPQVRALAGAKMVSINAAYRSLCDQAAAGAASLCYLEPGRPVSSWPGPGGDVPCRCWLCGGSIVVPAEAQHEGNRCGMCHALLGLRFDPTAT